MTTERDDPSFRALTLKISRARGVSCDAYKEKCLRRRIAVRMRARGVHSYDDYARLLDSDQHEYEQLLDALTINVTKCYRNPETWNALRPHLAALQHRAQHPAVQHTLQGLRRDGRNDATATHRIQVLRRHRVRPQRDRQDARCGNRVGDRQVDADPADG